MKMKCRECKTIYDNSEKYCPFCYARTYPARRATLRIDGERQERAKPIPYSFQNPKQIIHKVDQATKNQEQIKRDSFIGLKDKRTPFTTQEARQKATSSTNNWMSIKDSYAGLKDNPSEKVKKVTNQKTAEDIGTLITILIIIMVILSMIF